MSSRLELLEEERARRGVQGRHMRGGRVDQRAAVPPDARVERNVVREEPWLQPEVSRDEQTGERFTDDRALPPEVR